MPPSVKRTAGFYGLHNAFRILTNSSEILIGTQWDQRLRKEEGWVGT